MIFRKKKEKRDFRIELEDHSYRENKDRRWEATIYERGGIAGIEFGRSRKEVLEACQRAVEIYRQADVARNNPEVIEL